MRMQHADILVRINGDARHTSPRYNVSAAEINLLMAIHGDDAIVEVNQIPGSVEVDPRELLERMATFYTAKDADDRPILASVYPGARPQLVQTIKALGLPAVAFKAVERAKPMEPDAELADELEEGFDEDEDEPEPEPAKPARTPRAAPKPRAKPAVDPSLVAG